MDPLEQAKQKMAAGQPLNRDEVTLISNAGVTSSDIGAIKNTPPAATQPSATQKAGFSLGPTKKPAIAPPKGNIIPTPQNPENVANAQKVGGDVETYEQWIGRTGRPMSPSAAKEYAANLRAMVPQGGQPIQGTPQAASIPETPIQPVTSKAAPPPIVSTALKTQSPNDAHLLDAPVSSGEAKTAVNAMDQFLKSNPDGLTLANILDVVGVALSARGGVNRQTMLGKRKEAEMAYAQQVGQAQALKAMDMDNQSKLLQIQLKNAMATNNQEAALQIQNKLKEIEAQKQANIEQSRAVNGTDALARAGGVQGMINRIAGSGL